MKSLPSPSFDLAVDTARVPSSMSMLAALEPFPSSILFAEKLASSVWSGAWMANLLAPWVVWTPENVVPSLLLPTSTP